MTFEWFGSETSRAVEEAVRAAVLECAEDLRRKSSAQAPIDTGALRADCKVKQAWSISYVAYDLPYARQQHEGVEFVHPKGGKAKFLEDPFNENVQSYVDYIRAKAGEAIK